MFWRWHNAVLLLHNGLVSGVYRESLPVTTSPLPVQYACVVLTKLLPAFIGAFRAIPNPGRSFVSYYQVAVMPQGQAPMLIAGARTPLPFAFLQAMQVFNVRIQPDSMSPLIYQLCVGECGLMMSSWRPKLVMSKSFQIVQVLVTL
jgi:hypothetical protein